MNDKQAKKEAADIRDTFWSDFDTALEPKKCSKQAYLDELEELVCDAESRIQCVKDELAAGE